MTPEFWMHLQASWDLHQARLAMRKASWAGRTRHDLVACVQGFSVRLRVAAVLACPILSACSGPAQDAAPAPTLPDVVLITVDTLRADRVGGALTPAINAVGATGARFLAARTTAPAHAAGAREPDDRRAPSATGVRLNGAHRFDDSRPTLARLFKDAGHDTAAFVGAFVLDRQFGLATGFDTYDDQIARRRDAPLALEAERPASAVADRAIAWVRGRGQTAGNPRPPVLPLGALLRSPRPYTPPADALARAGGNAYDGEVAYADAEIGRLLRAWPKPAPAARSSSGSSATTREPRRPRRAHARDAAL